MSFKSFEELECWKASREVRKYVRTIAKKLPPSEKFDIIDNITRASRSATRNIAEGFGRYGYQDNIRFCITSRGSLYEIIDDLITCQEERYIADEEYRKGRELV